MASSGRTRLVAAVAAAAALLLLALTLTLTGAPAGARPAGPLPTPIRTSMPPPPWTPAPCASGAITGHQVGVDETGRPTLRIQGWIERCDPAVESEGFTVIRYFATHGLRSRQIVPYTSTPYDLRVDAPGGDIFRGPLAAVCVAYDVDGRTACVGLETAGDALAVTDIPIDDPRVLVRVSRENVYDANPTCGTCV